MFYKSKGVVVYWILMSNFTAKQKAFIDHYLICLNGTEAARRAKYKGDDNTLAVIASQNIRKLHIKEEIERRLKEQTMSADEVLYRLQQQAKGSLSDFLEIGEDNSFWIDLNKASEAGVLHLVKEIRQDKKSFTYDDGTVETTYKTTVKIHDSQSALDKLMRYYGLYDDKIRVNDWRSDIVTALQNGDITAEEVKQLYPDLASEFFAKAGVDA